MFKNLLLLLLCLAPSASALADIYISPYFSMSGTKAISKSKNQDGQETVTEKAINEAGLRAGVRFWRLCSVAFSVGQRAFTTTTFDQQEKDQWNQIDVSDDLDPNATNDASYTIKKKDTQNRANVSFMLDPSFWIFVARAKAGVTATQRVLEVYENDVLKTKVSPSPTYKPTAGVGFGVRLSPRMFAMAEYNFYLYAFPKTEPFEREFSLSFGLSIGG